MELLALKNVVFMECILENNKNSVIDALNISFARNAENIVVVSSLNRSGVDIS